MKYPSLKEVSLVTLTVLYCSAALLCPGDHVPDVRHPQLLVLRAHLGRHAPAVERQHLQTWDRGDHSNMLEWYVVTFMGLTYHIFEVEEVGYHYGC